MPHVLTINGGSSSIRCAIYAVADTSSKVVDGRIERIGGAHPVLTVADHRSSAKPERIPLDAHDRRSVVDRLVQWLSAHPLFESLDGVGHRIVHGMEHAQPERVTPELLTELKGLIAYDPEHLPGEIELIEAVGKARHGLPQVVCFDTAFHRSLPPVAALLPIPRRLAAKGVRRYGFHGLSYTFLMQHLARLGEPAATRGRVILAHLGNGASMAAVRDGRCIDTSMGFTPTAGLVMSTRSGDLDPGLIGFLAATESMDAAGYQKMVTGEAGLLGVSETSGDVRDLLERESADTRAAEALDLFCYQAKKWIGAFHAALGGLDVLVFAGGIGENAAPVRARICAGLECLGIDIEDARNARGVGLISADGSRVRVRVMATDEESVIAAATVRVLGLADKDSG